MRKSFSLLDIIGLWRQARQGRLFPLFRKARSSSRHVQTRLLPWSLWSGCAAPPAA